VASGWETEIAIGMDSMFCPTALQEDISAFYKAADQTRLRVVREAMSGTWEALLDRRVDILIGAAGEGPSGGGYTAEKIGQMRFVFAVAPSHPLANAKKPLGKAELHEHRAVSVSDSGRRLPTRTVGLIFGQDTLTVSDMRAKFDFQMAGIGFGFLPEFYAREALDAGLLVEKKVKEPRPDESFYLAWRTGEEGAALQWWIQRAKESDLFRRLITHAPNNR
jgi:DNA-binding transcriptional LysR family regulator